MKMFSVLVFSLGLLGGISAQTTTRAEAASTQQAPASCCKKGKSGEAATSCKGKSETAAAPSCHGKSETASASCCQGKHEAAATQTRENRRNERQQKAAPATRTEKP